MILGKRKKPSAKQTPEPASVVVPFPTEQLVQTVSSDEPPNQVFKFRLRNGFVGELMLPVKEIDRLWYKVQHPDDSYHFIVFENERRRFALNIRHVVATQFDRIGEDGLEGKRLEGNGEDLADFFFADSHTPLSLEIEPDEMTLEEFDKKRPDDSDVCQLANFFFYIDSAHRGFDLAERIRITDGSVIWFRLDDLSFVSVPLWLLADQVGRFDGQEE